MKRLLFLSLLLAISACGTSGPVQQRDGNMRSQPITLRVPHEATANPLVAPPTFLLIARAVCPEDEGCSGFFLDFCNPGGSDLYLDYTPVIATVDGEVFTWPDIIATEQRMASATGTFLQLGVDAAKFRKIAFAQEVVFNLGSNRFTIRHEQRVPLRQLLDAVQ